MSRISKDTVAAHSARNYHRRWEGHHFSNPDVRVLELFDYIGDGGEPRNVDITPYLPIPAENHWMPHAGNNYEVKYSLATDFVHSFRQARFDSPVIIDMGEMPAPVDKRGEPIGEPTISHAGMFAESNVQLLPRGGSRGLISNTDGMFAGCSRLRNWTPQELVAAGLAMVHDPEANRRLRGSGLDEAAFLFHLAPLSMRGMFQGCTKYNGHAINAIGWHRLNHVDAMADFATGCTFEPHYLAGIVESMHWSRFRKKTFIIPRLRNVNLGHGHLTGEHAQHARELISSGIEITGVTTG